MFTRITLTRLISLFLYVEEIKIRIEINEIENRESIEKTNETESSFSEKISNIDTYNQAKNKRKITSIRNEKEVIITGSMYNRIIKE